MHPRITMDGLGNPFVIWGRLSDASVFFSKWTGTAFTTPVKLNPTWLKVAAASWMGPDIASKGDTIYIVVKRIPEASDTNHIYIMRSFNGGLSFSQPIRVDFIADSISRFPTVSIDASGNPVVAFMKFNAKFGDSRWVVTKSVDYGNTFSKDVKASGYSGAGAEVCDCCPGAIVSSANGSAVLYRDNLSNIRDIWTGISTNNNVTFNNGFSADNTNWFLQSCPASGPDGIIVGDSLYTVFLSGASTKYRTYFSKSSISSGSVYSVSSLTGNIAGLSQQNYPRIATDGNAAAIVWNQTVNGSVQLPILFTENISEGFPIKYDSVDLNDITNADVALSKGNIFVVWEDDNSGTVKYRKGTYKSQTTGSASNLFEENREWKVFPNPTSDILNIELPGNDKYLLCIFNSLGEKIYSMETASKHTIQMSDFHTGIYFIQLIPINNEGGLPNFTKKIIKQ